MPKTTTSKHPKTGIKITFTEADHRYIDERGFVYKSATTFVKDLFQPFDKSAAAASVAARDGSSPEAVLKLWEMTGAAACRFGTRCHETAEAALLKTPPPHKAESPDELAAFKAVWTKAVEVRKRFKIIGVEMLVFDPDLRISGTLDLLVFDEAKNRFIIFDWKTNKAIDGCNRYGKFGKSPVEHIQDCSLEHYSMQLSLYELLLRRGGYIPADSVASRFLLWYNRDTNQVDAVQCRDRTHEIYNAVINDMIPPF